MKKQLLAGVAAGVVAFAAAPAMAQIDVTVGGHTKNYVGWLDQDVDSTGAITGNAGQDENSFDMIRESELHINAEGTADNGLVYGFHLEMEVDGGDDSNTVEESYLYLASNLGRVNLGSEDGANYLLQVAAPSADANIDGIRQYIQPVNYGIASANAAFNSYLTGTSPAIAAIGAAADGWDYDNDITGKDEKITYLSPVWNGFQFGLSYTPEVAPDANGINVNSATGLGGFSTQDVDNGFDEAYEGAVRYEGTFNNVGFAIGAGYTHVDVEENTAPAVLDDYKEWNVGADLDIGAFGVGAIWTENNNATEAGDEDRTWVVGVDYTTGPFQFGASYYDRDDENGGAAGDYETQRYTGGVIYTAAPGLSFRGSISHIEHESPVAGVSDVDATSALGGVQLNF